MNDLARVLNLVPALTSALDLIRVLGRGLSIDLDIACDLGHDHDRVLAARCAVDLAREVDRAVARVLGLSVDLDLDRACDLDRALDLACDHARALAAGLKLDRAHVPVRDHDLVFNLTVAFDRVRELCVMLDAASNAVKELVATGMAGSAGAGDRQFVPVRAADWLLVATARVVPVAERGRYAEEFRSELWELAAGGGGTVAQVSYAVRLLAGCVRLRRELRPGRRRGVAS